MKNKNKKFIGFINLAIVYNSIDIRGVAAEPIAEEILFECATIAEDLVDFEEDVKANTIFTEASATAVMQAYTSGVPVKAGSQGSFDVAVTPVKVMYYDEFTPDNLRFTRYNRSMKPGAWNTLSDEFERVVIGGIYAKKIALDLEAKFWNNVTAATKTAVAALTAGSTNAEVSTAEKALVAATPSALPFGLFDGVIQKMIYNASNATLTPGVGGRLKVVGTTITTANIKTEYDKLYDGVADEIVADNQPFTPFIYAPRSHKKKIVAFNNNATNYKDVFILSADKKSYSFNGCEIKFVPIPENSMILGVKPHFKWCTDLKADINQMKLEPIAANVDDWFIKNVMTILPHIVNQRFNTLYVG